jgi:dUTP pyrophosphatase
MEDSMDICLLHPNAVVPTRGSKYSAGLDLYCTEDVFIKKRSNGVIKVGINIKIPKGHFGLLTHRSSLAFKNNCIASTGIIDQDYRGDIGIKLFNLGDEDVIIDHGSRVAQLLIIPYSHASLFVKDSLDCTDRGKGGFGSTGV